MIKQMIRRAGRAPRAVLLAAAGVVTLLFAACDGDNLFEGRGALGSGPPRITSLVVPQQSAENARVDVRVRALAPRGLSLVTIRFRGATSDDQSFTIDPARTDTVTIDASLDLPATLADSVLRVEAFATDVTGAVSEIVAGTIRIVDASAPTVTLGQVQNEASVGSTIEIPVSASDPFGIRQLGFAFVTATKDTVLRTLVASSGSQRDTVFRVQIPGSIPPGDLSVIAIAVNNANIRGVSAPLALSLVDQFGPLVDIIEPANGESLPIRDSIRVRVHARDSSGIANIRIEGISYRFFPDSTQNSTRMVRFPAVNIPLPQGPQGPPTRDTVVFRFMKPNADTVSEPIYFIATVTDGFGNTGVDTVRVNPGPRVAILNPATGSSVRVGGSLPVRVSASDPAWGIDSIHLYVGGLRTDTIRFGGLQGTRDVVERSTLLSAGNTAGALQLRAAVWNTQTVRGSTSNPVSITVSDQPLTGVSPKVRRTVTLNQRVELADSIRIRVIANDVGGAGVARMGAVVIAIPGSTTVARDTFFFSTPTFAPPRGGTPDTTFVVQLRDTYSELMAARFPLDFTFQVHAFAIDAEGRCGAAVQETDQDLACAAVASGGTTYYTAQGQTGRTYTTQAVIGTSRRLVPGSVIADALPDTANGRVYLSNFARNQVDVLQIGADTAFRAIPVAVGSQPWGLFLAPGAGVDTLMVGNSGGTNISFVPTNTLVEDSVKRLLTPNEVLFDLRETVANGYLRYSIVEHEFSDRPQFVAQDRNRNILYSTKPTPSAIEGTARVAYAPPAGGKAEPVILIPGRVKAINQSEDTWAIAHIDSIWIVGLANGDDGVVLFDHVPGFRNQVIQSIADYAWLAVPDLVSKGSDIFAVRGSWNRGAVGFADTTYVAWSKDLSTIAFGEGDKTPAGRIMLWQALPTGTRLSTQGTYDLIANSSETVNGIALNANGSIGAARGSNTTYFFTNDVDGEGPLRLNGLFAAGVQGGSGGVALHPNHTYGGGSNENTLAFIATSSRSVKIVDTFHYLERGEVFIRDNIIGQLRASPPMPGINGSINPQSCNYTVVQLFGVTASQSVVMVNVRRRDIKSIATGQPVCNPNL